MLETPLGILCINLYHLLAKNVCLTRRLPGFEILNNATIIFQKWLVPRHFGNTFHYLNFFEDIYDNFCNVS